MRILIADDELVSREKLLNIVAAFGECIAAETGTDALRIARSQNPPDLILLDIMMPGMDGYEVCKKLKAEKGTSNIPIIFISVKSEKDDEAKGLELGAVDYITKPFSPSIVKARIRTHLELKEYRNHLESLVNERTFALKETAQKMQIEVAERKHAEETLRSSEEKYRSLFENAPIGLAIVDEEGNFLDFNNAMLTIHGYSREDGVSLGMTSQYYLNSADRYEVEAQLEKDGFLNEMEAKLKRRDGSSYNALLSMRPVDIEGQPLWHVMIQDISDWKKAEKELRKVRQEWEEIFHAIGHSTLIMDSEHRLIHANLATERATGMPEKDLIGKRCYEIFHHTAQPPEHCPFEKMLATDQIETVEMEIEALDGTFLVSCTPVFNHEGNLQKVIHIATDVTERKLAEVALRNSETYFREIIENSSDLILLVDETGKISYVSPSVSPILGYTPGEVIEKSVFDFIHSEDIPRAIADFKQAIQMEMTAIPNSFRVLHKDGSERILEGLGKNLLHHPVVSGFIMNVQDVTESRHLRDQLMQVHKMEAIATLTGGIAHDYNNLLSIVMGNLGLTQQDAEPGSNQARFLEEADKAVKRLRDLTHELMALSRGGAPFKEEGFLGPILKRISEAIPKDGGVSLEVSIAEDLWSVPHDRYKIDAVFRNVLTNAMEAMPQGGILTLTAENLRIDDQKQVPGSSLKAGEYVKITISDQGVGILEEHLDKIFDPYFSTKPMGIQKGMGLGLATAYAIVKGHDGHISVKSTPGVGTTVSIYLPAAEKEAPEEELKRVASTAGSGVRVLVMDDEDMLRHLAKEMLKRLGYEVETVKDGAEAIDVYKKHLNSDEPFDGVILDLTIKGGMGGEQTLQKLLKIDPNVKAIVCSGYFNDPVMTDFQDYGFKGAMAKPYETKDLKEALEKVLRAKD